MEIQNEVVLSSPFCALRRLRSTETDDMPNVLVVSPLSGHRPALLSGTLRDLLPSHRMYTTDWFDAADVPADAGRFGWDEMICQLLTFLRTLGPGAHVLSMSQSCLPVLTATAIMAERGDPARPRSVTLMGGLIDTTINPTPMNRFAAEAFGTASGREHAARMLLRPVPRGLPGEGRLVYPGSTQRAALELYLLRRMGPTRPTPLAAFQEALVGDGSNPESNRAFYDAFLRLADLPAEIYLDTMTALFDRERTDKARIACCGRVVDLAAISDTALMTVEAAHDDISGSGQTRCAQALCAGIPDEARLHYDAPSVGHLGMFHGRIWLEEVLPRFADFVRRSEAAHN